jgi:predicted lysophospholipase L1 biosynthesis ABC-type transport system permease subunit
MTDNLNRARDMLPTVVITVLSMIQALALELYWSRFSESDYLWQWGWDAVIGWLQFTIMLVGIIQIWLFYVSGVLRFTWMPTMEDTTMPFIIGLFEFAMVDLMEPQHIGPWFIALAAVFTISIGASHLIMRRARKDSNNDYFFRYVDSAKLRDYVGSFTAVGVLFLAGIVIWLFDVPPAIIVVALVFALAALLSQMKSIHKYWLVSPQKTSSPEPTPNDERT